MSYCRFADGDAYVYRSGREGIFCCGCRLGKDFVAKNSSEMLAHLREHIKAGDKIPQHAIDRLLREEKEENDNN